MLDFVRYPAARSQKIIHAAPQFRPIKRGARRKGIERKYLARNGDVLTISLFHELDVADQDLLLCLLAIARAENRGNIVSITSESVTGSQLRKDLDLKGVAEKAPAVMVKATGYELLTELGRNTNKQSYEWLKSSLRRLSKVSFDYDCQKGFWSFNLLSVDGIYGEKGEIKEISVCINPLSAQAILGSADGGYVLCHRGERQQLKTEEARALHSVLCGLVDMGSERVFNIDMLADKTYARYDEEISDDAMEYRRKKIKLACKAIDSLSYWLCLVEGRGKKTKLTVRRKRRND